MLVFLLLVSTSGAVASWTAAPQNLTATPTAAAVASTLTGTSSLATQYKFAVASSSPLIVQPLTVTNTGTAPLTYALSVVTTGTLGPATVTVSLWLAVAGLCQATVPTGAGLATTGTLAALPALPAGARSAAAGGSFVLCAATSLGSTVAASQGLSITVTFTMTGSVGTNWSAPAAGSAFTQTVFRTADPGAIVCTPESKLSVLGILLSTYVTLSWSVPAPTGTGLTYPVLFSPSGLLMKTATTNSVDVTWSDLRASPQALVVKAAETQYGTTSAGRSITLTGNAGIAGLLENVTCP